MIKELPEHKKLILFDGVCNLCNSAVQYVIKHDKNNVFMFAALQSDIGAQVLHHFNIDVLKTDSIVLYSKNEGLKTKSTAALHISKHLGFPRYLMSIFFIVPGLIRNWVYDYVAKNRYKWYGKQDFCWVPTPKLQLKFIGNTP